MGKFCTKCGKKCQNDGARMLHEANCKGEETGAKGGIGSDQDCKECKGKGSVKLLNKKDHEDYIKQGFTHYCSECLELY